MYAVLADAVVLAHATFVVFVVLGGFLALRWRHVVWAHLPAAAWGAWIELSGGVCPLTPLENWLRVRAGEAPYAGGFVERCVVPVLYPAALTRGTQVGLGILVIVLNGVVYWRLIRRGA